MKKFAGLILSLVCAFSLAFSGCSAQVKTYTADDTLIECHTGDEFIVALTSNPSTGYSWDFESVSSKIYLVEKTYTPDNADTALVGSGGTEYFRFRALDKEQTELWFYYSRPWDAVPLETLVINLKVS
ncbi:protease inhibitor I42 family protein [Dehalococcoides sp.]|jgi:inhibitor of cysteine peptidase|uniref:protease inhibitor I42 family protein n=1 Tax=Dehalococcoides sp. TaxID=1966486 RepID=UPI00006B062B